MLIIISIWSLEFCTNILMKKLRKITSYPSVQIILQKCCLAKILEMNWNLPLIILKMILLNLMLLRKIVILLSVIMVMSAPSIMRKCM